LNTFLDHNELEQIPFRYRLLVKTLLKLPIPGFPFFILKHFPEFEGIFWSIFTPILLMLYAWFQFWWFVFLSTFVGFPLNVIFGFALPAVIVIFFLRIQLERAILRWKKSHEPTKEWVPSKSVEELLELFERQRKRKKTQDCPTELGLHACTLFHVVQERRLRAHFLCSNFWNNLY
jgi:hypothetical protein